jgi:uncharacterized protein (DUF2236 family)
VATAARSKGEDLVHQLRDSLGDALRERVVGPRADERAAEIMDAPGERWFDMDRPIRIVHSDATMFIGGLRALLVQALHPLAMTGVAQHSDFRNDPWGRLQRTADFLAATTFGPAELATATIARINHVHSFVKGTTTDGIPYSARDPHLLRWVHVVEAESFLSTYQRYGARKLTQSERDGYVEDMARIASELGVTAPPRSERALRDQLNMFRGELRTTEESRDAVHYLLLEPPLEYPARAAYGVLAAATIATLPRWSRPLLQLPYLPLTERAVLRPLGHAVTSAFRWITQPTSPFQRAGDDIDTRA